MTKVMKELVQRTIPAYLEQKGINLDALAVKLGIGVKVLRNVQIGKWDAVDNKLFRRIWSEVVTDNIQGLYQTADFQSVFDLCTRATSQCLMIGLTGDTGMGKSTGLKAFALRPNVFYYYIDRTVTPRIFFEGLIQDMGIQFEARTLNALQYRSVDELNSLESPLLILDECGKLSDRMIMALHSLRDLTKNNCGIVLAGMPDFKNSLIKQVNRGTTGYSEFFRRINLWHSLTGLSKEEIKMVLVNNGITDAEDQRDFRKYNRFGDLMNEIMLHKSVNE